MFVQKEISLNPRSRGFHLITDEVLAQLPELSGLEVGLAHFFILHTSASLAINENASPDVASDLESHFNRAVPENAPYYSHTVEGPDDMPAHIKAVMLGSGHLIPVSDGRLKLGTWQGLFLCEHRNRGGSRRLLVTLFGSSPR